MQGWFIQKSIKERCHIKRIKGEASLNESMTPCNVSKPINCIFQMHFCLLNHIHQRKEPILIVLFLLSKVVKLLNLSTNYVFVLGSWG